MRFEDYDFIPDFEEFIRSIEIPQPYWIRVNTLKISEEALVARLEAKGFLLEKFPGLNAYRIVDMPVKHPGATVEHSLGYYYVQDLASMLPPIVLDPHPGERVLDMAAAPGSKTTQMAAMMNNSGTIVANDLRDDRIRALAGNVDRMGALNVIITKGDARYMRWGVDFHKVLLDAPCTGEGVVRKTPKQVMPAMKDHKRMSRMQKAMVRNAWEHLADGGLLLYSTCTFNPLENEEVVRYAVEEVGFELMDASRNLGGIRYERGAREWREWSFEGVYEKVVRIYPHRVDTGGMFIALLKK